MRECSFCGAELSHREGYQLVTGWVSVDKRDGLTLREDVQPPTFACRPCIKARQLGVPVEQGSIL